MKAITIHPNNKDQEKVIKMFLDALHVRYEPQMDETNYLLSTKANRKDLLESIEQAQREEVSKFSPEDLWK